MKLTEVIQRSGMTTDKSSVGQGKLVKKTSTLNVYQRSRGGKEFFDFVETGKSGFKFDADSPIVYTYAPASGNLTMGSGSRWSRQEILTASKAAQSAGKKSEIKDDMPAALKVAIAHYAKYIPK